MNVILKDDMGNEHYRDIPDSAPTPRVILDRELRQCFVLGQSFKYYVYHAVPFQVNDKDTSITYDKYGNVIGGSLNEDATGSSESSK